jgi:tungstate transport system substrate-binding protein
MNRMMTLVSLVFLNLMSWVNPLSAAEPNLMMATTTSTDNTGLLEYLAPHFQKSTGILLRWTATGTGKALRLGENCDVDILMVHAPNAEKEFVARGFGVNRREIMYNDFVIVGPTDDPAGLEGKDASTALRTIQTENAVFVSRGDNSGTHKKELYLWAAAKRSIPEKEPWYVQTGQGMLATLNIAAERNGYTLTDRGTYIKYEAGLAGRAPFRILVEGEPVLINRYSVVPVNPEHCAKARYDLAMKFMDWICAPQGQGLIRDFKLFDKPLFIPSAR